ncbi:hypothetical protein PFISCL1PPCAC_11156, partial [Pristionchus fissidentatus]
SFYVKWSKNRDFVFVKDPSLRIDHLGLAMSKSLPFRIRQRLSTGAAAAFSLYSRLRRQYESPHEPFSTSVSHGAQPISMAEVSCGWILNGNY